MDILAQLRNIVGPHGVLTGDDAMPYCRGARYGQGQALCVVRPATTKEVSEVVATCAAARVRLVPQGANTGPNRLSGSTCFGMPESEVFYT